MRDDLADITIVLDRSGSMESVKNDTIGGFNSFIDDQRKIPGFANVSLCQFDTVYEELYAGKPLPEAPKLTNETFLPRGGTALLDAIGRTINATGKRLSDIPEAQRPSKVIFVIITDGEENSSKEFTRDKVFEMISKQRDVFKWQFVFIGANQDAISTAAAMGIAASNSLSFAANSRGTRAIYTATSSAVGNYRTGDTPDASFTDKDREEQKKAGASS